MEPQFRRHIQHYLVQSDFQLLRIEPTIFRFVHVQFLHQYLHLGFREILFCISIYVSLFHLFYTMYLDYVCQFQSLPVEIIHLMDTYLSNLKEFISLMNSACQILIQTRFLLDPVEEKISLKFHLANLCSVIDRVQKKYRKFSK